MPFFRAFRQTLYGDQSLTEEQIEPIVDLTRATYSVLIDEVKLSGFWNSIPAQNHVKGELQKVIVSPDFKSIPGIFGKRTELISRVMEIAKANHEKLIQPED